MSEATGGIALKIGWRKQGRFWTAGGFQAQQDAARELNFAAKRMEAALRDASPMGATLKLGLGWEAPDISPAPKMQVLITNRAPHALAVDRGRAAQFVPIAPLENWVAVVLGLGGKEATRAAYGISRKQALMGVPAKNFVDPIVNRNWPPIVKGFFDGAQVSLIARFNG